MSAIDLLRSVQPEWMTRADCLGTDPDVFFGGKTDAAAARRICRACPVREACREFAIADASLLGVWGGTTERERRAIRKHTTTSAEEASA